MIAKYFKRADKLNKIYLPKFLILKYGRDWYMEVYEDGSIKLIPKKRGN